MTRARRRAAALALTLALGAAVAGCGTPAAAVRRARAASYDMDGAAFFGEVTRIVQARHPRLAVAEPGRLVTEWSQADAREAAGAWFRLTVTVGEGPPWRPVITGELRGAPAGEPPWLRAKIDELYLLVYDRLEPRRAKPPRAPASQTDLEDLNR